MMAKSKVIANIIIMYPEGDMNLCGKFPGNVFNSCCDILLKSKDVNLMVTPEKKSGDHKSQNILPII